MSMHGDAKSLREQGDRLFSQKQSYDRLNQEIADHFYPQRASFTTVRDPGEEFADHLMTGYPVMVHRDLSNQIGTMLRPRGQPWFHVSVTDKSRIDHEARAWLEQKTQLQRQLMYDRRTNFARATKEGDADFAAFGGCCISTEVNRRDNALLYRCWHLRDVAWTEDSYGQHNATHINWKPKASELRRMFKNVHHKVEECGSDRAKDRDIHVRRVVIRADDYDWKKSRTRGSRSTSTSTTSSSWRRSASGRSSTRCLGGRRRPDPSTPTAPRPSWRCPTPVWCRR
jgi:hypothetical protein